MTQLNPKTSPNLPWRIRFLTSFFTFIVDASRRPNLAVNRCLCNLFDLKSSASNKPIKGVTTSDITVNASRNLWFRLYTPTTGGGDDISLPVIVYFHGGGFAFLAANSKHYDSFCKRLARELHVVVVSVNYRLAPEHRYPCQCEDGVDVLKFIDSTKIENFPSCANLNHCFIAGDSAGGNLAHQVVVQFAKENNFRNVKIIGLIAIQPFLGGEERTESEIRLQTSKLMPMERADWMWRAFLPEGSDRDHPVANVFGPNSVDISDVKFPATIVFIGAFDPLQDWQKRYYEGLKKCKKEAYLIEYPNAIHSFYVHSMLPESSLMIEKIKDFIRSQSANNSIIEE